MDTWDVEGCRSLNYWQSWTRNSGVEVVPKPNFTTEKKNIFSHLKHELPLVTFTEIFHLPFKWKKSPTKVFYLMQYWIKKKNNSSPVRKWENICEYLKCTCTCLPNELWGHYVLVRNWTDNNFTIFVSLRVNFLKQRRALCFILEHI